MRSVGRLRWVKPRSSVGVSRLSWLIGGAIVLVCISLWACGGGGGGGGDDSNSGANGDTLEAAQLQFLRTIGNGFIAPTYTALDEAASGLIDQAAAFCANPLLATLDAIQAQWREVMAVWMQSEVIKFGPAEESLIDDNIYADPVNPFGIQGRIDSDVVIDAELAFNLPLNQRGLRGIEYLLFDDIEGGDDAILARYTTDENQARWCAYLRAVIDDLQRNTALIRQRWQASDGNFIATWNSAGGNGNTAFPRVQDAIDTLVTEIEFVIDNLVNVKLNGPRLQSIAGGLPDQAESFRSGNSIANALNRIEGTRRIYLGLQDGVDSFGIDDYLQQVEQAELDQQIRDQFQSAAEAVMAIPGSLYQASQTDRDAVLFAVNETRELLRLLKREMAVVLDVFFGFNDADGD